MTRLRFGWRLLLSVLGLLMVMQVATWWAVDAATKANGNRHAEERLHVGTRVFQQLLSIRGQQLLNSAAVIVADFGFKQAVGTRDVATIESMLDNHGSRIGASAVSLLDLKGDVIASTVSVADAIDVELLHSAVQVAQTQANSVEIVQFQGKATQLALVPMRTPARVGWVAMYFVLDDALLARVAELTGLDVSIARVGAHAQLASTLTDASRAPLLAQWPRLIEHRDVQNVRLGENDYLSLAMQLDGTAFVFTLAEREVLSSYQLLRERLVIIVLAGLFFAGLVASLLAKGISGPLQKLAHAASAIGRGEYGKRVELARSDELGELAVAVNQMQEDIQIREKTILYQSLHDGLTGLPNRSYAQKEIEAALGKAGKSAHAFSVLMLDLDRFKEINDTLGHAIGDKVLQQTAQRIRGALRDQDVLARLGGDEFMALVEGADSARAFALAQRIQAALDSPIDVEGMQLFLDASIGIACYPADGNTADGLLRRADIAMYDAKQSTERCVAYLPGRDEGQKERLALVNALRLAIPRGEMRLEFQPKWDMREGKVGHAEALVRWQHPELGLLMPDRFVALAEHSGRIRELTEWVLDTALFEAAQWQAQGVQMGVAVNLSALDLLNADLPEYVRLALLKHRVEPADLLLEITEGMLMRDATYALRILHELRDLGVELAIDDFGTGYSSLSYLQKLPVSELKIDRSFVRSMLTGTEAAMIVRATIDLGHNLGLRVVAEGVEDQSALALLNTMRCDQAQGYFVARPMPASALAHWHQTRVLELSGAEPCV